MIVRNEERNLPRCLDSVRGLADQLIVVDTGSTDTTPRIAADRGATVLPFDFSYVDFAAARNYALAQANGHWILMLDADETLGSGGARAIMELAARNENTGYYLERHNHTSGRDTAVTDYLVRLFPACVAYRFHGRVHETIDNSILGAGGTLRKTDIRIDHSFSADPEARRRRNLWYIEILKEEIAADPSDTTRLDFLAAEYHQLGMFNEATKVAERIVQLRPRDYRAHLFAGIYHLQYKGEAALARCDFERALELCPDSAEAGSFLELTRH
jgi:glycosyltransferase involved in cell wall biosynthesis